MATVKDVINAAGRFLLDPDNRCTEVYARHREYHNIILEDAADLPANECRYCLIGALGKFSHDLLDESPYNEHVFNIEVEKIFNNACLWANDRENDYLENAWDTADEEHQTRIA